MTPEGKASRFDTVEISGPKLKVLRRQARLTQQRLANPTGISRGYIGVIERESQIPVSRTVAEGLAGVLGINISDLEVSKDKDTDNLQPPVFPSHRQKRRGFRPEDSLTTRSRTEILQDVLVQLEELTATVQWLIRTEK